ncbi:MAG: ABC transporter permease, partial [Gaiellales bacterium]
PGWGETVGGSLKALVLPSLTLGLAQAALLTRYVRSALLDVLRDDFMRTAQATGRTRASALWRHGLRNAAIPLVTVLGLQIAGLLVGAVVVEYVFTLPGLGKGLLDGIHNRDTVVVQDIVMLLSATVLVVNLLVDLSYRVLDPRLRGGDR